MIEDEITAREIAQTATGFRWGDLSSESRDALTKTVTALREHEGRAEHKMLQNALYRRYQSTPNHSSLAWSGTVRNPWPSMTAVLQVANPDGTNTNQLLRASFEITPGLRGRSIPLAEGEVKIEVVGEWTSCHEEYWERLVVERVENRVVMQNEHWTIGKEGTRDFQGYGGAAWTVFYFDGRTVHTTNLWHQGIIPPVFRDRLANNAVLVSGHHDALTPELMERGW